MPSSSPMRWPTVFAYSTQSSMLTPLTGMNGQTSVAPRRGCSPWWWRMSISSAAFFTTRNAASITASGSPAKVMTVRLVSRPGSTSSSFTPSTPFTSAATVL